MEFVAVILDCRGRGPGESLIPWCWFNSLSDASKNSGTQLTSAMVVSPLPLHLKL